MSQFPNIRDEVIFKEVIKTDISKFTQIFSDKRNIYMCIYIYNSLICISIYLYLYRYLYIDLYLYINFYIDIQIEIYISLYIFLELFNVSYITLYINNCTQKYVQMCIYTHQYSHIYSFTLSAKTAQKQKNPSSKKYPYHPILLSNAILQKNNPGQING